MANRALIIAGQHYGDSAFDELPGADADARALSTVLADESIGDYAVTVVRDPTARDMRREIQRFFSAADRQDLLLLHISCHGLRNPGGRLFLIATDTDREFFESTSVDATFVNDQIESSRSSKVVLLLDCCFSGAFTPGLRTRSGGPETVDVAATLDGRGRVVISASTALQFAHESEHQSRDRNEPSVFTRAVVDGLSTGEADLDHDGRITVDELYQFVHDRVRDTVEHQTPTKSVNNLEGTLVLATAHSTSLLPWELTQGLRHPSSWQRRGAVLELESFLGTSHSGRRAAAIAQLATMTADVDPTVARAARDLWQSRGLGELPAGNAPDPDERPRTAERRSHAAGIDFGTTNSSVAILGGGEATIQPNGWGDRTTPTAVALDRHGDWLIGAAALRQAVTNPDRTFTSIKRLLGSDWSVMLDGRRYTAVDLCAVFLEKLVADAEETAWVVLNTIVITVPAYFSQTQRDELRAAAKQAFVILARIITEPTAAALAYGIGASDSDPLDTVLVVDLGGGTYDLSLLEIENGVSEVKAAGGDLRLGGDDWTQRIQQWLLARATAAGAIGVEADSRARRRLRDAAEQAKRDLSVRAETSIVLPYFGSDDAGNPVDLSTVLTRIEFDALTSDLLERMKAPFERLLRDTGIQLADVDSVVLVGGASRMPAVVALIAELTGRPPRRELIPDGVALGAAIQAGVLRGEIKDLLLLDVLSESVGIVIAGNFSVPIVPRNTTIPTKRSAVFTTTTDDQDTVHIQVVHGDRERTAEAEILAVIEVTGLPALSPGAVRVNVTVDVDANGLLHLVVDEPMTGHRSEHALPQALTIQPDPKLLPQLA